MRRSMRRRAAPSHRHFPDGRGSAPAPPNMAAASARRPEAPQLRKIDAH
jgi:hypothetical protein